MVGTKRRDIGLGGFPTVTLAQARETARQKRDLIDQGIDPVEDAKARRSALQAARNAAISFTEAAKQYIASKEAEWKNSKHGDQWRNTLAAYAEPVIGSILVADVNDAHVLRILQPIWQTKTETAKRVQGRIEHVLDWARVRGYRKGENPARWRGHLDKLLPAPKKIAKVAHQPALPVDQMHKFYLELLAQRSEAATTLRFLILTASRSGEVRGAQWSEMDLNARTWTIPAERMKAGKEHTVALSSEAIQLLQSLSNRSGRVFPAPRGGELSDMTLTALLRRMSDAKEKAGNGRWTDRDGRHITVHGFRSTFRDWAGAKTHHGREVIEHALAHQLKDKAEAAYARDTLLEKRSQLMADWATYCTTPLPKGSNVVQIMQAA